MSFSGSSTLFTSVRASPKSGLVQVSMRLPDPTLQGGARSASSLLAAPAAHCSSTSRQPARSPASPVT
eukprot:4591900-Prymnesium_polylepis.1